MVLFWGAGLAALLQTFTCVKYTLMSAIFHFGLKLILHCQNTSIAKKHYLYFLNVYLEMLKVYIASYLIVNSV